MDDFFGEQERGNDEATGGNAFGEMGEREVSAQHAQLKNVSYLESFDSAKEERLQEGFEAGYRETFNVGQRLGELLGSAVRPSTTPIESASPQQQLAVKAIRSFLTDFEARPLEQADTLKADLETLQQNIEPMMEKQGAQK